ncbi:MAG: 16S rRNA (guanine(527)-N(7))-methyltransferase RsmG [Candidatus Wallbacteria bacterium]|nr:16S rRNA (guanine(527)-N(7))-methyltransferase RsmG [Candidatus Wallbacteria bacterium]
MHNLPADILDLLQRYADILWQANQSVNLIGYRDKDTLWTEGIEDSIFSVKVAGQFIAPASSIIDIGSGGGLPGMAAAAMLPDSTVTLVESIRKKCDFLNFCIAELGIKNCFVVQGRIEEYNLRGTHDLAFCRAVAELAVSLEYTLPFLKTGGIFIAHKGKKAAAELTSSAHALTVLGAEKESIFQAEGKCFIVFRKKRETASCYPRKNGLPARRPL